MSRPKDNVPPEQTLPAPPDAGKTPASGPSPSENCASIKALGFITHKQIKMYGEHLELVSDPFVEGDYAVVQVISRTDPVIRTLRLPVSILVGLANRFKKAAKSTAQGKSVLSRESTPSLPLPEERK